MRAFVGLLFFAVLGAGIYGLLLRDEQMPQVTVPEVSFSDVLKKLPRADEKVVDVVESPEVEEDPIIEEEVTEELEVIVEPLDLENLEDIPAEFNLAVPFTPQAPDAIWDMPYAEACEESSAYMVSLYFEGYPSGLVDAKKADNAILKLVDFEKDFFGFFEDTTAAETVQLIDMFYGYSARVVDDPTSEQIKREIAAGRPVIVPAAGRELLNPFFSGAGPLYHMFVVKGYTEDKFIVNDPGTRRGADFAYDISTVMNAMGDWNSGDPANGAKVVIFVAP